MTAVIRATVRGVTRTLGIPRGSGIVVGPAARRKLVLGVIGSVFVAFLEVVAVAAVLPLMLMLTGQGDNNGFVAWLRTVLGGATDTQLATALAGTVLVIFVARSLLTMAFRWWMSGVLMRQEVDTSVRLLRYYLCAPYRLHLQRSTAEFIRNLNDAVQAAYATVIAAGIGVLTDLATITAMAITLLVLMPVPTLIVIAYFGLASIVFQRFTRPRTEAAGVTMIEATGSLFRAALQAIGGFKEIRIRGTAPHFVNAYEASRREAAQARRVVGFLTELPKHAMEILFVLGIGVMTAAVFWQNTTGSALAMLALFAAAGFRVLPSVVRALSGANTMRSGLPSLRVVADDLRAAEEMEPRLSRSPGRTTLDHVIAVESVGFAYANGPPVLTDVSCRVAKGSAVAFVGSSGAGKSTLIDIILGLHHPTSGRVTVDGRDIAEDLGRWQSSIGMVPQSVYLLDGTVRENVAFGIPEADIDSRALDEAIHAAQLSDVVDGLADGISTALGEGATRLSGGQRQRLGIARALYHRPEVLIFDEATSALDNETEHRITSTMRSLRGAVTLIVVAHRLSTVRFCDQIVLMEAGRVVAVGSFEDLVSSNADFRRMVELGDLAPRPDAVADGL